jgi:ribulose kinase
LCVCIVGNGSKVHDRIYVVGGIEANRIIIQVTLDVVELAALKEADGASLTIRTIKPNERGNVR